MAKVDGSEDGGWQAAEADLPATHVREREPGGACAQDGDVQRGGDWNFCADGIGAGVLCGHAVRDSDAFADLYADVRGYGGDDRALGGVLGGCGVEGTIA